jgi:hypothetical protein
MCLANLFPTFRRNVPPSFSGIWVNARPPSKRWQAIVQQSGTTTQKTCFLNPKTGLQMPQLCVISRGQSGNFPALLAACFAVVFFVSVTRYKSDKKYICYYNRLIYISIAAVRTCNIGFPIFAPFRHTRARAMQVTCYRSEYSTSATTKAILF